VTNHWNILDSHSGWRRIPVFKSRLITGLASLWLGLLSPGL